MTTLRTLATFLLTLATAVPCVAAITTARDDAAATAGARGITVADLNRDGWLDIATANNDPDGVSVLINRGVGGGYRSSFIPIAGGPFDITNGDLNRDGVPDLVVANPDANEIDVLFGQASGGFSAPLHIGAMFNPRGVAVGDIDKDGKLDIVYTLYYNQGVVVLYGDGAGNFAMRNGPGTVGVNPQGVAIADFNMDGWPDLVVASSSSIGLTIMYQVPNGSGTFARQDLNVPTQQNVVVVGDFNRDGRPDIAAASTGTSAVTIYINGKTFTETLVYASGGGSTRGIAAIDLDRDGAVDVVTGNRGSSTIDVLPGRGDGTFGGAYGFAAGAGSRAVAVGDFNNDGRIDIASANEYAANATVLSNTTAFTKSAYALKRTVMGPSDTGFSGSDSAAVADFDLDGRYDAVTRSAQSGASVVLGSGSTTNLPTLSSPLAIKAAHLNGDAYPDVLLLDHVSASTDRSRIEAYLGAGNGQFPGRKSTLTSLFAYDMQLADFNGDGRVDAVLIGQNALGTQPNVMQVYLGNGDGSFTAGPSINLGTFFGVVLAADVNRDGSVDITALTAQNNSAFVVTWLNDGRGGFTGSPRSITVDGLQSIAGGDVRDIDHDGWPDLVVAGFPLIFDVANRSTAVLKGGGSGFGAPSYISTGDRLIAVPRLVDMTLDGNLDVVTEDGVIVPGNGDGSFGSPLAFDYFAPGLQVLDFNKDGLPDVLAPGADGAVQIMLNEHRDTNLPPTVKLPQDFSMQYRSQFGDGEENELDAQGSDPDLHRLTYKWFDADGHLLADTGADNYFIMPTVTPGGYTYTVEVSDGRGGTARDSVVVTVLPEKELVFRVGSQYPNAVGDKWSVVSDLTAADGVAVHDGNAGAPKVTAPLASPSSYIDVEFVADPTQTYKLWLRLKAENDSWANDSVWLQFTGAVDASGNTYEPGSTSAIAVNLEECSGCGVAGWGWRDESWGQKDAMGTLTLRFPQGGIQHLRFQTREDGVSVDQLVLSAEKYRTTRPGVVKNDATILPPTPY